MHAQNLQPRAHLIEKLLSSQELTPPYELNPISGGRNNRAWKLECNKKLFFLKEYYSHPSDTRDRLKHEYQFLQYAHGIGLRNCPIPLACDPSNHIALYQFIEGTPVNKHSISQQDVVAAENFLAALNQANSSSQKTELHSASEACFSIKQHMECAGKRIRQIQACEYQGYLEKEFREFIESGLTPAWQKWTKLTMQQCQSFDIDPGLELTRKQRCISPSDFGFHNALRTKENKLVFIDFEYAGIDDPTKMVSDFFCQPDKPPPLKYFYQFQKNIAEALKLDRNFQNRLSIVFPICKIKWVAILLNEFQNDERKRREFSKRCSTSRNTLANQLKKAKEMLTRPSIGDLPQQ